MVDGVDAAVKKRSMLVGITVCAVGLSIYSASVSLSRNVPNEHWPLTGRGKDVSGIVQRLTSSHGSGILLVGDPGVGKSRLNAAALDACNRADCFVLRITATAGWQNVPLGALAELVPESVTDVTELFRQLRHRLHQTATRRPVIIGVDDANWLDEASTRLIERLLATRTVNVLATVRGSETNAAPVMALRRAGHLDRIDVAPLDRTDLVTLVNAVLGPVDGLVRDALWRITLGNPLFLRELLRTASTAGALTHHNGMWSWRQNQLDGLRYDDLITLTVGALTDAESTALAHLAYAEPIPLTQFRQLVLDTDAEQLEERGLIQLSGNGPITVVRLAQPLYGEAIRARTSRLRRARVLRDLVEVMAPVADSAEDRMRIAAWRCDAGLDITPADLLEATETALLRGGASLAERLARHIPGPTGAWQLGRALIAQGRSAEAEEALANAYPGLPEPAQRARAAALRTLNLFWGLRQPQAACDTLAKARQTLPDEAHPELLVAEAGIAALWGSGDTGLASVLAAMQEPSEDPLLTTALAPLRPCLLVFGGAPAQAADEFTTGHLPIPQTWPSMRASTQASHVHALLMCGQLDEAATIAERYYQDAVEHGSPEGVGLLATMRGICHGNRGQLAEADRWTQEALAVTDAQTLFPIRANILGMTAWWSSQLRDFDRTRDALQQVRDVLPPGSRSDDYARLAEAMLLAMSGQRVRAGKALRKLSEEFLATGVLSSAMEALHLLSRLEPGAAVAVETRHVAELTDSPLFLWQAEYAEALADNDPDQLKEISEEWEQRGYQALALEAAVRADLAGRPSAHGRRLGQRIADLRRRCPNFWPAWLNEPERATLLTRREREVAELAAGGLSNAEIAERLVLSVRTVENHLQRSFDKLGVRQRGELARTLQLS